MTNHELNEQMAVKVKTERKITREILDLINLAEHRRLPLELGYRDTYDWLIRGHGYSGSAAHRRVQAARLLRDIPEVADKVEAGVLNLTTLCQTQRTIKAQQKIKTVTLEEKKFALERIAGKTSEAAERELSSIFPEAVVAGEKTVHKRDGGKRITIELSEEEARELERSRELLSHSLPGVTQGQVIARLAKSFNDRNDPMRKRVTAPVRLRSIAYKKRVTMKRDLVKCTYQDPESGRVCGSTFQIEVDHIIPKAKGGSDDPSNLRCLCRKHNQLMAEIKLGREFMAKQRLNSWLQK